MTAATFEDATTLQGAPRPLVEDAWVALNKRYATGAGVLIAALALLWAFGFGPNATRGPQGDPGASLRTADAPSGATRPAAGTPSPAPAATGAGDAGASRPGAGSGPGAAVGAAGPAAPTAGGTPAAGASSPPATAGAPSTPSASASGAAAGAGDASSALPRPVPGAPVARLYFEPDQAWPSGEVGPRLAPVLARLKADPDTKALVSGFHDRRGSVELNAALAKRRAETVRRVLIREGVAADRIVLARPQQTTGSGANREARRVEVTVAR